MTVIELRVRSKRVPEDLFPGGECRIWIGEAETSRQVNHLRHQREVLRKLARRGQWKLLRQVKDGEHTVEEVVRLADEAGVDTVHLELRETAAAPTIGEAVEAWVKTIEHDKTRDTYERDVRRLVEHVGAETPITEIGSHDVDDAVDHLREDVGLAHNTLAGCRTAWSAFFSWFEERDQSRALTDGRDPLLRIHPVRHSKKMKRLQSRATRRTFLTEEQYRRLMEHALRQMRPQYATLTYAGLRAGELVHLRPVDVDLPSVLRIRPHGPRESHWVPKGYPNHEHSVRDVPIHQEHLLPLLEWYERELAGEERFFVNPRTFRPWTHQSLRKQLERDCTAAGLPYGRDAEGGITPHVLRHTLASWLAQKDVQLMKIARILGNTVETVSRYYAHLLPSDLDETLNRTLRGPDLEEVSE